MRTIKSSQVFTLLEPGPVVLVTTHDGRRSNVMTISWTMVLDFRPRFAITTGTWNYSYRALRRTRECVIAIPTVDMLDTVIGDGTFIVDGRRLDRRRQMAGKIPAGV